MPINLEVSHTASNFPTRCGNVTSAELTEISNVIHRPQWTQNQFRFKRLQSAAPRIRRSQLRFLRGQWSASAVVLKKAFSSASETEFMTLHPVPRTQLDPVFVGLSKFRVKHGRTVFMFYTVHCSIIANESQQNAQMIYIFSQFVAPTCFGRAWPSSGCAVTE